MNQEILFPDREIIEIDGVRFPAVVNGRTVACKITVEALQDRFGLRRKNYLPAFKANRTAIENMVKMQISVNPSSPGPFIITTN